MRLRFRFKLALILIRLKLRHFRKWTVAILGGLAILYKRIGFKAVRIYIRQLRRLRKYGYRPEGLI